MHDYNNTGELEGSDGGYVSKYVDILLYWGRFKPIDKP